MDSLFALPLDAVRHERAMTSLCDRTGAPLTEVRNLYAQEFSRLELGAKVRTYLAILTATNVRAMLRSKDLVPRRNHEMSHVTLAMTNDGSSPWAENRTDRASSESHALLPRVECAAPRQTAP
jgi:uncharacterized protein DUF3562